MLGKLFAHELRALWKPATVMLAVMVIAGAAGIACVGATEAITEAMEVGGRSATDVSMVSNATMVLVMAALFCGFIVWASVVALYVFVVMRFYRTMFTDEGYLTLTLPVKASSLVMAKFWAAYLLMALFSFSSVALFSIMVMAASGDADAVAGLLTLMGGPFAFVAEGDGLSSLLGVVNTLVNCAYALGLAFGALTLGAWWARRHKVACAVGVYLGAGWLISLLFSIASVLVMIGDVEAMSVGLGAVSAMQLIANIGVAVGALALSSHLVRTKVDLN